MSKMPQVSVIVPCFNRHALLEEALTSARAQQGVGVAFDLKIIVVDDASAPPLRPALGLCDQVIHLEKNRGAANARNVGVDASNDAVIAFLDSDDVWAENKLASQLPEVLGEPPNALSVSCTGFVARSRSSSGLKQTVPSNLTKPADFTAGIRVSPGSTAVMRRDVFDRVGPFDTKLRRLEDFDWYVRFGLMDGCVRICPELLAMLRPSGTSHHEDVVSAVEYLQSKSYETAMNDDEQRAFSSFLNLVRADANFAKGFYGSFIFDLTRSFCSVPRLRLQIAKAEMKPWPSKAVFPVGVLPAVQPQGPKSAEHPPACRCGTCGHRF